VSGARHQPDQRSGTACYVGSADKPLAKACGRGLGKTIACRSRQTEVAKLEAGQVQATTKVVAQARPESTDFAKLVTWVSRVLSSPGQRITASYGCYSARSNRKWGGLVLMLARG
jgi:hypothetical protein